MTELVERREAAAAAGATLARGAAVEVAQLLYDAYRYGEWEGLNGVLHPYARFVPLATSDGVVLGRDDLLARVAEGPHTASAVLASVQLTPLADDAVLCVGRPRWMLPNAAGEARAAIVTLVDGLLFRERAFESAPEAVAAFLRHGRALGIS